MRGIHAGIQTLVKVNVIFLETNGIDVLETWITKIKYCRCESVEVTANSKGELLLACLGEKHLESSLLDLQNVY